MIDFDRALGTVMGSAVGDALGAPFEFGPPRAFSDRFRSLKSREGNEMIGGGAFRWAPGEFTDDTAMAIVQAESHLRCGGFDGADLFSAFRTWAASSADVGAQTSSVLHSRLPWDQAAADHYLRNPDRAAGNGSLMRAAPAAVFYATGSLGASLDAARTLSSITHGDPATGWGCALLHGMIHFALRGGDPITSLDGLIEELPDDQIRYRTMLNTSWRPSGDGVPNGSVWGCLADAVWAVRTTQSFAAALEAAIDLGGDTDTVAAVTGAIAGARYGFRMIPRRWLDLLHGHIETATGRVTYRTPDLERLTRRLLASAASTNSVHQGEPA